jgi:hypothetical protein
MSVSEECEGSTSDRRNQQKRAKMHALMAPAKAHVRNGYFVSDEPANLPEGTPVELQLMTPDPWAEMARRNAPSSKRQSKKASATSSVATPKTRSPTPSNFWRTRSEC